MKNTLAAILCTVTLLYSFSVYAQDKKKASDRSQYLSDEEYELAPFTEADDAFAERARLLKQINYSRGRLQTLETGGLVTAVGAGLGYLTWALADSSSVRTTGAVLGLGSYAAHEYLVNFEAVPRSMDIIRANYIMAAQYNGLPGLKRNPAMKDIGYLSGTRESLRTEYKFDGYFWASAFASHSIVFTYKLVDGRYDNTEITGHSIGLGVMAALATMKFYFAYKWDNEFASEMRRLHLGTTQRETGDNRSSLPETYIHLSKTVRF